jgi:hypothetical protein
MSDTWITRAGTCLGLACSRIRVRIRSARSASWRILLRDREMGLAADDECRPRSLARRRRSFGRRPTRSWERNPGGVARRHRSFGRRPTRSWERDPIYGVMRRRKSFGRRPTRGESEARGCATDATYPQSSAAWIRVRGSPGRRSLRPGVPIEFAHEPPSQFENLADNRRTHWVT